ncbi:MAG: spermidine/putrescine ABC transporter substrate-binding protein [Anaerolineae bacterium]
MIRLKHTWVCSLLLIGLLSGCGSQGTNSSSQATTPPLADSLTIYGWPDDLDRSILEDFTSETGVLVNDASYPNQETAIIELQNGEHYDLVVMSNELMSVVIEAQLAAPLDRSLLPNIDHLEARTLNASFDPDNTYSVPFKWGTFGLLLVDGTDAQYFTAWRDLWTLPENDRIITYPLLRYVIGFTLKSLGYSINTEDPDQLEAARQRLLALLPQMDFASTAEASLTGYIVGGGYPVATTTSREALEAAGSNVQTRYILPSDGAILWGDNFMIPTTSENVYTAHVLLNYLLRPDIGARLAQYNLQTTPNREARALLADSLRNNPLLFPNLDSLQHSERILALSAEGYRSYQVIWDEVMETYQQMHPSSDS